MIVLFYLCVSLILILVQTALVAPGASISIPYDLILPFIIFLGIHRPLREGFCTAMICGLLMDQLSGGPLGLYMSTYFWVFWGTQGLVRFLQAGSWLILPFVIGAAVLFELLVFSTGMALFWGRAPELPPLLQTLVWQTGWAIFTGPLLVWALFSACRNWEFWAVSVFSRKRVNGTN